MLMDFIWEKRYKVFAWTPFESLTSPFVLNFCNYNLGKEQDNVLSVTLTTVSSQRIVIEDDYKLTVCSEGTNIWTNVYQQLAQHK